MTDQINAETLSDTDLDDAAGGRVLMRLKNAGVMRDRVNTSASSDPLPTEEVTLGYTEVEWSY